MGNIDYSWINNIDISTLRNGLNDSDNQRLFITPFVDEAVYLISKGLKALLE